LQLFDDIQQRALDATLHVMVKAADAGDSVWAATPTPGGLDHLGVGS